MFELTPMHSNPKTLRDYQSGSMSAVHEKFDAGSASTLVVLPTGLGKTVLFSRIASNWNRGNVLILAHRIELLDQAADKLKSDLGYRPPIEQGQRGLESDMLWQGGNVIVGSLQTMRNMKRMRKYKDFPFGLVIVDEAHHAVSASYRKIIDTCLEFNPDCKVMGVTATPNRADDAALGIVFDSLAFEMHLQEGIERGWLCDIEQEFVQIDDVDFSGVRMRRDKAGNVDFNPADLEALLIEEGPMHAMTQPILDRTQNGEQALIFNAGVTHANIMAYVLNKYKPGSAAAVDADTPPVKRQQIVSDYQNGRLQYLTNFGVFTEGFDCPSVSLVVMARPTKSLSLYLQMLGRGTRPLPGVVDGPPTPQERKAAIRASAKPAMRVIDYVGNSRHKPCSSLDALGGDYDVEIKQLAEEYIREKGAANVREQMEKAKADYELLSEQEQRKIIKASSVSYTAHKVDVFGQSANPVGQDMDIPRGGSSEGQIGLLVGLGVDYATAAGYSRKQAAAVIDKMSKTRCTKKQFAILQRFGYPMMPMAEASKVIDVIMKNGWKRPNEA